MGKKIHWCKLSFLFIGSFLTIESSFGEVPCAKIAIALGKATTRNGVVLKTGLSLMEGTEIETGSDSWVKVLLIDNSIIDLGPGSHIKLTACRAKGLNRNIDLEMEMGRIRAVINKLPRKKGNGFRIKTNTSILAVRGTEFFVIREESQGGEISEQIGVSEGQIEVRTLFDDMMKPLNLTSGSQFQAAGIIERSNGAIKVSPSAPLKIDQFTAEEQIQFEEKTRIETTPLEDMLDLSPQSSKKDEDNAPNERFGLFIDGLILQSDNKIRKLASDFFGYNPLVSQPILRNPVVLGPIPVSTPTIINWGAKQ